MTKQLLTALLIAGLSTTAKAEPTVYYCEMKHFVKIDAETGLTRYRLERFPMQVDARKASFGGDGYLEGSGIVLDFFNPKKDVFYSVDGLASLRDNILLISAPVAGERLTSVMARCDKF